MTVTTLPTTTLPTTTLPTTTLPTTTLPTTTRPTTTRPTTTDPHPSRATVASEPPTMDELVRTHHSTLLAYVSRWTLDRQLAEDIVQETWLKAWRHQDRLVEERGSVRGWLLRVAHNVTVDVYRARRARVGEVVVDENTDGPCPTADRDASSVLDRELVRATLQLAPTALRPILVQVYLRDQTVAQAAATLGLPEGTVKSRLHYGLPGLRQAAAQHSGAAPIAA